MYFSYGISSVAGPALDPSIIQSLPTFSYSCVKDFRQEEYGREYAICLGEFVDDDLLRLLRACYHVFHTECIDLWFESHTLCLVCRRVLDETENRRRSRRREPTPLPSLPIHDDTPSITIKVEEEEDDDDNNSNNDYERGGTS